VFGVYAINNKHLIYKGKMAKLVQFHPGAMRILKQNGVKGYWGNCCAGTVSSIQFLTRYCIIANS